MEWVGKTCASIRSSQKESRLQIDGTMISFVYLCLIKAILIRSLRTASLLKKEWGWEQASGPGVYKLIYFAIEKEGKNKL